MNLILLIILFALFIIIAINVLKFWFNINLSWLKIANGLFFQLFFVRLTKCIDYKIEDYKLLSFDMMENGSMSSRGFGRSVKYEWYSLQYFVVPFSGWKYNYSYLGKGPGYIRLTKRKIVEPLNKF